MKQKIILFVFLFLSTISMDAKTELVKVMGTKGNLSAVIETPDIKTGQKIPMVIICHGFCGNKNEPLHKALSDSLLSKGIASIRFDFNGHGESDGDFQEMTILNEIEDAKKIYKYVRALPYVSDIAMTGHSQGGVVAAMTTAQLGAEKIKSLVLFSAAAVLRDDALRGNLMGKIYNAANPPEYVELWGGKKVGNNYIKIAQTLPIYETAKNYMGPTLIIHGTADIVVPYTYSIHFNEVIRYSHLCLLQGMDHGYSGHMAEPASLATRFLTKELK